MKRENEFYLKKTKVFNIGDDYQISRMDVTVTKLVRSTGGRYESQSII